MPRTSPNLFDEALLVDLLDVELEARCECGHRHPEHSLSGSCHGCHDCDDEGGPIGPGSIDDADEHVYERCRCTGFQLAGTALVGETVPVAG